MPVYDYQCTNETCSKNKIVFEVTHSIKADKPKCVECNFVLSVVHSKPPTTVYNGKWFKNSGSY